MIELWQMRGTDTSGFYHVFDVDFVYRVVDGERRKIGILARKTGATLKPLCKMADDEADALVAEVNEAREREGKFGPIAGIAGFAWTKAARERYAELIKEQSADE